VAEAFPKYTETFHKYFHQSAGGWPATKIFGDYDDAVSEGVAWYFSCTGDLAPDPDPEGPVTVAVHEANKPVIVDPDGAEVYVQGSAEPAERGSVTGGKLGIENRFALSMRGTAAFLRRVRGGVEGRGEDEVLGPP